MATHNITLALASAAVGIRLADAPAPVLTIARQAVLDWFGVTVAGAGDPAAEVLAGYLESEGGHPSCGLVGRPGRLPASAAAALNGTASHALDYDDVNFSIPGHATAPVLAAALAVAEEVHATGAQLLEAFVAGYETSCRIGQLVAPNHYTRGFHATATLGCFGASVATARLLGLDVEATARAMGIAATRAAGLKAAFGSSCKALQVGEAARSGLVAARLAQRGMDAPGDMLGHKLGFARTHSHDMAVHAALGAPRYVEDFAAATTQHAPGYGYHLENNLFKFHNSCYETHSAIECALHIVRGASFAPADVAAIEIRVNPHCDDICNIASPATPLQARFSLRHTVAMALSGKSTADPLAFDTDSLAEPQLLKLREFARVVLDPALRVPETVVRIRLRDARMLEHRHDSSIPGADLDTQQARLVAKYKALSLACLPASAVAALEQAVTQLEHVGDVGELARLTVVQRH